MPREKARARAVRFLVERRVMIVRVLPTSVLAYVRATAASSDRSAGIRGTAGRATAPRSVVRPRSRRRVRRRRAAGRGAAAR